MWWWLRLWHRNEQGRAKQRKRRQGNRQSVGWKRGEKKMKLRTWPLFLFLSLLCYCLYLYLALVLLPTKHPFLCLLLLLLQ